MKYTAFSSRNAKEIIRDPLSILFGIGFPVILILLMQLMKASIKDMPPEMFQVADFAPGMAVFGLSFITLFLGLLIANDRNSSFLMRLFASPMTGLDYILGYSLPMLPIAILQCAACFLTALFFGLPFSLNTLLAVVVLIPVAVLFSALGLLLGSILSVSQVGGISSLIINVAAWLSGVWFNLDMIGGVFKNICYLLPFAHAVDSVKAAVSGDYGQILPHIAWVMGYALLVYILAIGCFKKRMKS